MGDLSIGYGGRSAEWRVTAYANNLTNQIVNRGMD
jgi:outer membrane receptor protein involved in Fe transport